MYQPVSHGAYSPTIRLRCHNEGIYGVDAASKRGIGTYLSSLAHRSVVVLADTAGEGLEEGVAVSGGGCVLYIFVNVFGC